MDDFFEGLLVLDSSGCVFESQTTGAVSACSHVRSRGVETMRAGAESSRFHEVEVVEGCAFNREEVGLGANHTMNTACLNYVFEIVKACVSDDQGIL